MVLKFSKQRCLTTVVCLFFLGGAPAGAQQSDLVDQVVASVFSDIDVESQNFLNTRLAGILSTKVRAGSISKISKDSFSNPEGFTTTLRSAWPDEQTSKPSIDLIPIDQLISFYHSQFEYSASCEITPLPLPTDIDEAVVQITSRASIVHGRFEDLMSRRDLKRVRDQTSKVLKLIGEVPYISDLSNSEKRTIRRYLQALDSVEMAEHFCSSKQWLSLANEQWLENLQKLLLGHPKADDEIIAKVDTEFGQIIFGGKSSLSLIAGGVLFLADIGGDDVYLLDGQAKFSGLPQLLVDFAGHDTYESSSAGALASSFGSFSGLIDFQGDDQYLGTAMSLGSSVLGIGFLQDRQGKDHYVATNFSQGFALYGVGLLQDLAGDDEYEIKALGQGLGLVNGIAQLDDKMGDDSYIALGGLPTNYGTPGLFDAWAQGVGLGVRGLAPGGIGILIDGQGSDHYNAGAFGQGGGYYFGTGVLIDRGSSQDSYRGTRYNFAWGAHGGIGYFSEAGGDDLYSTRHSVAGGLAWDRSLSLFQEHSGDDNYELGDFSVGAAGLNSIAYFFDFEGSDQYTNMKPADADDGPPNVSVFTDANGIQNSFSRKSFDVGCSKEVTFSFVFFLQGFDLSNHDCLN